jgi:DNA-binding MarR family transcriptional regulator
VISRVEPVRIERETKSYPNYDHASRESFLNLERAHVLVRPLFEHLFRPYGVSGSTFNVLMILRYSKTPLAPHEIGERVVVTRPTVTGLLHSLESQGLIKRDPDPGDGRRRRVQLTDSGKELVEDLLPQVFALLNEIFSGLTASEKETLIQLLAKVQATAVDVSHKKSERGRDTRGPPRRRTSPVPPSDAPQIEAGVTR